LYVRTQVGYEILAFLFVPLIINGIVFATVARRRGAALLILNGLVGVSLVVMCVVCSTMTIRVDSESLQWSLTYDLVRSSIPIDDIRGCAPGSVPRFLGLGYHTNGRESLLLVNGRSIVAIRKADGRVVSLGTDDPAGVCSAIDRERATIK
jgi:hypothetical protein